MLSCNFGPTFETIKVTFGGPGVFVSAINCVSKLVEYEAIKGNLGAFEDLGLSPAVSQLAASYDSGRHLNGLVYQGGPH